MSLLLLLLACQGGPLDSAPLELELSGLSATPHELFPTLLEVDWQQNREASVQVQARVVGEDWREVLGTTVAGLPYGAEVELRLVAEDQQSEPISLQLEELPLGFPVPTLTVDEGGDPALPWVLGSICQAEGEWVGGIHWSFVLDRQGRVVWARKTPMTRWTLYARQSRDGRSLLLDEGSYWAEWDAGAAAKVQRLLLDGTELHTYATEGLQHSYDELPQGGLVYGAARVQDEAVVRLHEDGTSEEIWTCKEGTDAYGAYCFSNTVSYDEASGNLLFSNPDANQIAELTLEGQTLALYGTEGYGFQEPTNSFKWQHGSIYDQDGHLLVSTHSNGVAETVVRAYEVDHEAQLLRQVYSFGEGLGLHGEYGGSVVRSEDGYLLQELGSAAVIREASPAGELVWQVEFEGPRQLGRAQYIQDLYTLLPEG